ncbi:MAG: exodeoxyribonuclease V subunit alpha [Pseudomonadota bacterium]
MPSESEGIVNKAGAAKLGATSTASGEAEKEYLSLELLRTLTRLHGELLPSVKLAIELSTLALNEGHVCLQLDKWAGHFYKGQHLPSLRQWQSELYAYAAVGRPGDYKPFILDNSHRFYFTRYWLYEQRLAQKLLNIVRSPVNDLPIGALREELNRLFTDGSQKNQQSQQTPDWQKVAAASAAIQRLCIITGGPGTGKTTTVVKLLAALQYLYEGKLNILLAAPTGKAAARMSESIRDRKPSLGLSEAIAKSIPETASTLHRLLKTRQNSQRFYHDAQHPLPLDVLVIDEASMIDLALMAKVVDALPEHSRLILLGDQDQLDSVEAGAVFGQLCSLKAYDQATVNAIHAITGVDLPVSQHPPSKMSSTIMELSYSFRFGAQPGIGQLAQLTNAGKGIEAVALLRSEQYADIVLMDESHLAKKRVPDGKLKAGLEAPAFLMQQFLERVGEGFKEYWLAVHAHDAVAAFKAFLDFRVLAAHRKGEYGVHQLNDKIEAYFKSKQYFKTLLSSGEKAHTKDYSAYAAYAGRPIMVTENDYALNIFNGDIGLFLEYEGELKVVFETEGQQLRWMSPARLPAYTTAFAMTVHKSQGSEFNTVALVLPPRKTALLSRNLIYTGITRAKKKIEIWGEALLLVAAIESAPVRYSGLADALKKDDSFLK